MFRRELFIAGALAAAIFMAVAGAGWLTVHELHETSRMLVVDTLPGLVDTGLAGEKMHDNRHTMYEMLFPHTAAERAQMIQQVKTNSTEPLWQDYTASIFEPADLQNYQVMMLVRSNYVQGAQRFLDLVTAGKMDEASAFFNGELSRSFQGYNDAAKILFDYNVRQGMDRGKIILDTANYSPWIIAGLSVLVFGFGLALGMRSAWSGPKPVRRRKTEG
jgi:hypothetical protein